MVEPRYWDTCAALEQLRASIQKAREAPPFRKLELAGCALDNALVVLDQLNERIAQLEQLEMDLEALLKVAAEKQ